MPSVSEKQRKYMGAELARKRAGKKTQTGMSENQLREFAGSVSQHGSLNDISFHENAATCEVAFEGDNGAHPIHSGYRKGNGKGNQELGPSNAIHYGSDVFTHIDIGGLGADAPGNVSALRDIGNGVHVGAPVDYFGPDTDYRAEELDPHQYGRDWEPIPFRDYYKTEDEQFERGFRMREQDQYDESATPGCVVDDDPQSTAYGAAPSTLINKHRDVPDHRSFESQREFARTNKDKKREYVVDTHGLDTKRGRNIR